MKLGFIGLGDMGLPMARRLLAAKHQVIAWNRSPGPLVTLAAEGAESADSPAAVIAEADLVGLCLTSHETVAHIGWGGGGLFSAPLAGRKYIADFSTGAPEAAVNFARRAAGAGASWVDAPVSGGVAAAAAGSLIVFAGGLAEDIAALEPIFAAVATRVTLMGGSGAGQSAKICNQMIVSSNIMVLAETFAMARRAGIDVSALPAAFAGGFADSKPLQIFGPRMANHQFTPRLGAITLMAKDAGLAAVLARGNGASTPILDTVCKLYAGIGSHPLLDGANDLSCIIGLFEDLPAEESRD
jgi:3-hydroxyisobutyrate dehydrogenase